MLSGHPRALRLGMAYQPPSRHYFATRPASEIGAALVAKLRAISADKNCNREEMEAAYCNVYGRDTGYGVTSGITRGGERGELALLKINHNTGVGRAKLALVTAAQQTWKPSAKDGSSNAASAIAKASDVLENDWKDQHMGERVDLATEWVIWFSESFVFSEWDPEAGPPLLAMGDELKAQGDIVDHVYPGWEVRRDNTASSFRNCQYLFVPVYKNKYDLAKTIKQLLDGRTGKDAEEAILGACDSAWELGLGSGDKSRTSESDMVPVWHFFHHPSAALPMGRHVCFLSDNVVLYEEPIRGPNSMYEGMPVERMVEREMVGSPHAWAPYWDTMGGQEICDGIDTGLATIATSLANPILASEQGSDFDVNTFGGAARSYKYPRGGKMPQFIPGAKIEASQLEYRKDIQSNNAQMLGLNDIAMGQSPGAQMNAQAFAVLMSAAVQQAAPLQSARTSLASRVGTNHLKLRAKHVKQKRTFSKSTGESVSYTGEDIKGIDSARVEIGNPMEQTVAGKQVIMDHLIELGYKVTPEQYQQVMTTGRYDPISKTESLSLTLAQRHREMLERGESPPVHWSHNHPLCFREGSAAALTEGVLNNEKAMAAIEAYLDEHYLLQFGVPRSAPKDPATGQPVIDPMTGAPAMGDPMALMRERWMLGQEIGPGQEAVAPAPVDPASGGAPPGPPPAPTVPPDVAAKDVAPGANVALPTNPATGDQLQMSPPTN